MHFWWALVFLSGPLKLGALDVAGVLECLLKRYASVWDSLPLYPRLAVDRVALTTYHRWMHRDDWLDRPGYFFLRLGYRRTYMFVPSIGAAGVRVGSQLDHLLEPAWDSASKLVARIIGPW